MRLVLRTIYSEESNALWHVALDKMRRWVTHYLVHINRLILGKSDTSVANEISRRFAVDIIEDQGVLRNYPNLMGASQDDIKSLVNIFEIWRNSTLGYVYTETISSDNPRFSDFLVIDEGSLRSLAALPEETPHVGLVSRAERFVSYPSSITRFDFKLYTQSRKPLYEGAYIWLIDSRAAKRFSGVEGPIDYNGLMKLRVDDIYEAWFERVARFEDSEWIFKRTEEAGEKWYSPR